MKKLLTSLLIACSLFAGAQEGEGEPGHMHGPDGRHIVAPLEGGKQGSFILSHHDMRIEGPDGKSMLGCEVDSTIHKKGDPKAVIHTEHNAYEPENEVYGSHMTYTEPGEYVIKQAVKLADGKKLNVEFPVYVPALAAAVGDEHAHGPNYLLIGAGVVAGIALLFGVYRMGQKSTRVLPSLLMALIAGVGSVQFVSAQDEEEPGHMHGPDGRHIVAPDADASAGPKLKAYPTADLGESASQVVDGVKFTLSIENEEVTPDPDLVTVSENEAKLIGLKTASVESTDLGGGLQATGEVSANPNGLVTVNARVAGRVVSLGALPGTAVRAGQNLAVIESTELATAQAAYASATADIKSAEAGVQVARNGLASAETRLQLARQNAARQRKFAQVGAFSSPSLEAARASASQTQSTLAEAKVRVDAANIRVQRLQQGVSSGVVSQRELDDARASLDGLKLQLHDAENQANIAREALKREEELAKQGLRTAKEVETADAEVKVAEAALRDARSTHALATSSVTRARAQLSIARDQVRLLGGTPGGGHRVSLQAPIGGEVEERMVSVGQTVLAGQELYKLLNAEVVWVLCNVYESDVERVRVGQRVEVYVDAYPGESYPGEVAFVHNEVDAATRTTKVRIVVNNRGERLKQHMFARVQIGTESSETLLVPTAAIQVSRGVQVVYVVEKPGTYRRAIVQVGGARGNKTVVRSGLTRGQTVVTDGAYQLLSKGGNP